jgi:hypothetical protein
MKNRHRITESSFVLLIPDVEGWLALDLLVPSIEAVAVK